MAAETATAAATAAPAPPAPEGASPAKKVYTLADLKANATEKSCFILVHGKVYNVTSFLDEHPGGFDIIISSTGAWAGRGCVEACSLGSGERGAGWTWVAIPPLPWPVRCARARNAACLLLLAAFFVCPRTLGATLAGVAGRGPGPGDAPCHPGLRAKVLRSY